MSDRFKRDHEACEACGWRMPVGLARLDHVTKWRTLLHAHHVVPIAWGGPDHPDNLVVLCPTHHAVAHALGRIRRNARGVRWWEGPQNREHLLHELKLLDGPPQGWDAWAREGRDWDRHLGKLRGLAAITAIAAGARA